MQKQEPEKSNMKFSDLKGARANSRYWKRDEIMKLRTMGRSVEPGSITLENYGIKIPEA